MKSFLTFLLGVALGFGAHWLMTQSRSNPNMTQARANMDRTGETLKDTFNAETIKEELSRTGQVIREKSKQAGAAISDAASNARITATIKTKLLQETALSALKIDVDTTDGVVTLSGTVPTHDEIATAMNLAWDTEGVHRVVSTLQVKPPGAAAVNSDSKQNP